VGRHPLRALDDSDKAHSLGRKPPCRWADRLIFRVGMTHAANRAAADARELGTRTAASDACPAA